MANLIQHEVITNYICHPVPPSGIFGFNRERCPVAPPDPSRHRRYLEQARHVEIPLRVCCKLLTVDELHKKALVPAVNLVITGTTSHPRAKLRDQAVKAIRSCLLLLSGSIDLK